MKYGGFYCSHNQLTSLEGEPKEVGGFYCGPQLTDLVGSPVETDDNSKCSWNQLTSLEVIDFISRCANKSKNFDCRYNPLKSTKGINLSSSVVNLYLN